MIHLKIKILNSDEIIQIIYDSFHFLVKKKRVFIYGFVIMPNHIHLIWSPQTPWNLSEVQHSLLSFTAKKILSHLDYNKIRMFEVNSSDRRFQIWRRQAFSFEIYYQKTFEQKLNYIHMNPVAAGLVNYPEDFCYSSYKSYLIGNSQFNFLTLW